MSSNAPYRAWKFATDVILVLSPASGELVAAPRTSLLPIQIDTNVGCARSIICACVSPPRMNWVSVLAFEAVSRLLRMSITSAPGTAVLLMNGGGGLGMLRSAHVVGVPPPTRVCRKTLVYGGGQPGLLRSGEKNGECIPRASSTAYDCCWVLSLIPPDWKPAVIELPIET